jgi:glycine reductase
MFRLERAGYPVHEVLLGSHIGLSDGVLTVDLDELVDLVREDDRIDWASVDVARPGDATRVVNAYDVWQPMIKVDGPGQAYPAVSGRDATTVGQGRTNWLDGVCVVECSNSIQPQGRLPHVPAVNNVGRRNFFDMSGPRSELPHARLINVCVAMERNEEVSEEDWNDACRAASLRVSDRLARVTIEQAPPEVEVFDTSSSDPALPNVVYVPMNISREQFHGPRSVIGPATYGLTRQSAPWLLDPTEILDGAMTCFVTWYHTNNPNVLHLLRGHAKQWNFVGVIHATTNWTSMPEKEVLAHRIAEMARRLGAEGAIVTLDVRGARFVETILTIQALERADIKTVFLTEEEASEGGEAPPLLMSVPELVSVVSMGDGAVPGPFPAVQNVLGCRRPHADDYAEQPGIRGGYGQAIFFTDIYGSGYATNIDF